MFLRYFIPFILLTIACNNLISSDEHEKLMARARTIYPKPRPIDDPITLADINTILPYVIKARKDFINSYKRKLAAAQENPERWNSNAWSDVRGKLWKTPTHINKIALNYFGYNEFLQFQPDPYKYYSTESFTEFFKKQLRNYAQNNLVKEFMQANEEIIRIRKEIDEIGTLRHFINDNEGLKSGLQYGFKKLSKEEALTQLEELEKYQNDLNKSKSPLIHAEMKRSEYQKVVAALKDIRDYVATIEEPKKEEPKKPTMEKAAKTEVPTPPVAQPAVQKPVTIQTPVPAQQKAQSYWEVFKGYMAQMARMIGL